MKGVLSVGYKQIPDSPWHAVNEFGEVMSLRTGRILKGSKDKQGRIRTTLAPDYKARPVHKLVADAFLPPPKEHEMLIHKDGNNSNNRADNLEWVDKKEYQRYLYSYGKNHGHRGLQPKPVIINETGQKFDSISDCARFLGVDSSSVRQHLAGNTKTCKGYTISYL